MCAVKRWSCSGASTVQSCTKSERLSWRPIVVGVKLLKMDTMKTNAGDFPSQLSEKEAVSLLNSFIDSSTQEGDKEKLVWILRAGCAAAGLSKQPDREEQPQQLTDSESEDDEHETVT